MKEYYLPELLMRLGTDRSQSFYDGLVSVVMSSWGSDMHVYNLCHGSYRAPNSRALIIR